MVKLLNFYNPINSRTLVAQNKATHESIKLLAELKQYNVQFAHWKGNNHLLQSLAGKTDIEILLVPGDRHSFEAIMNKLEFKRLKSQFWNSYPQVEDWIGFDAETGNLLHLHTHYALVIALNYGRYLYLDWAEVFFKHLKIDEQTSWPIPKPEMEALLLLIRIRAKMLYKGPAALVLKQNELVDLLKNSNIDCFISLCKELQMNVPENLHLRISNILNENDSSEIISLSEYFYSQVTVSQVSDDQKSSRFNSLQYIYHKYYFKAAKLASRYVGPVKFKKTLSNGGKMIALIGSDGSGKSTLSKDLVEWLTIKIDTHYFYMGKMPFIKSYNEQHFFKSDIFLKKGIISKLFRKLMGNLYYIMLIKKKIRMIRLGKNLSKQGSIIICDRFPQKHVSGFNDGPKLQKSRNKFYPKIEMKFFNLVSRTGIDLVFRLKVSPEIAAKRKPEHDYEIIKQKCISMNNISFDNSILIEVDADRPYDQVLLHVKSEIWKHL